MIYWGIEVYLHAYLISALDGIECSSSRPGRFVPAVRDPATHWRGRWVDSRAGLDAVAERKNPIIVSAASSFFWNDFCLRTN
jgi:hypothetical protein